MTTSKSLLVTGVPLERGNPDHIELDESAGDFGFTDFGKTGKVEAINTPQAILVRVHELMHARHTVKRRYERQYAGVSRDVVKNITEDARLHINHWPWPNYHGYNSCRTPKVIEHAARAFMVKEFENCEKQLTEHPEQQGTWGDFATKFRMCAVGYGLDGNFGAYEVGFANKEQRDLAIHCFGLLRKRKPQEGEVAKLLEATFFPPPPMRELEKEVPRSGDGRKVPTSNTRSGQPPMEIIELPLTDKIPGANVGQRLATSGSRMYRPALRRPILPQRMFIRRAAIVPGGTILIDASSSMGDWNQVKRWCELAPFGTIAYYAGGSKRGWLYVYARNGKRAGDIVQPRSGNNTVDGPAMDWLLQQAAPRIMVTDRGFCGAPDSVAQKARLGVLERTGDIKVVDYSKNSDDD